MSECPDENAWAALGEELLGPDERAVLERHLDDCERCSQLVAELAWLAPEGTRAGAAHPPERYRVVRQLGQGAMGVVWEAEDTQLGRRVALKWVRPDGSSDGPASAAARARLWREARALAQLRHPNVLTVHDVGEVGGEVFLALELVLGQTARAWRAAAARTPAEILGVWCAAAEGLAAVHRAGLVHRDIKPDNVLVADDGRVLVGDFGLATGDPRTDPEGDPAMRMTATGQLVGTPSYMAPEQLRGEPATAESDQFAWCASTWEALTGARPFRGSSVAALAVAMMQPPVVPAGAPERNALRVLARGLDPDPARRWPDLAMLVAALALPNSWASASRSSRANLRRRAKMVAAGVIAAAALAASGLVFALSTAASDAPPVATRPAASPDAELVARAPERATAADVASTKPRAGHDVQVAAADAPPTRALREREPGASPIPVQPALKVNPPTIAEWRKRYDDATDRLGAGDARGCLLLLAKEPPVPADVHVEVETLRALCIMASGDCAGGRAEVERVGRTHGWSADQIAREVELDDVHWCPLEASPVTRQPARALHRLAMAVSAKRTCAPILAAIERLQLAMPTTTEYEGLRVSCAVLGGDCAGGRARFVARIAGSQPEGSSQRAKMEAYAEGLFVKSYPSCATP